MTPLSTEGRTALVCIHGITDSPAAWKPVLPYLELHHDVLAVTLAGHTGGAALVLERGDYLGQLADGIERDMDAAGLRRAHIVGNSLGGRLALELAARGRALSAVSISPAGGWAPGSVRKHQIELTFRLGQAMIRATGQASERWSETRFGRRLLLGGLSSHPADMSAQAASAFMHSFRTCPSWRPILTEVMRNPLPAHLGDVDCPIRIIWGAEDRLLPLRDCSQGFRILLPQADFRIVDDAGHVPMHDRPAVIAQLILQQTRPGAVTDSMNDERTSADTLQ